MSPDSHGILMALDSLWFYLRWPSALVWAWAIVVITPRILNDLFRD